MENNHFNVAWAKSTALYTKAASVLGVGYPEMMVLYALESMGKRVPEDVMICGFDGIYSVPPTLSRLTTISTPANQLGSLAATTLLHKLAFPSEINSSTYLHTKIIYRESAPEV